MTQTKFEVLNDMYKNISEKRIFLEALEDNFKRNVRIFLLGILGNNKIITFKKSFTVVSKKDTSFGFTIKNIHLDFKNHFAIEYFYVCDKNNVIKSSDDKPYNANIELFQLSFDTIIEILKVINNGDYELSV